MTKRHMKPITYAAAASLRKRTAARKEAPMSPQITETHVPDRMTLTRRATCSPRADERPLLRDERGRVLAVVEAWSPTMAPN